MHLNIRSLLTKLDEVKLNLLNGKQNVLGFSERWLHNYVNDNLIEVSGYQLLRQDRCSENEKKSKDGGGLFI